MRRSGVYTCVLLLTTLVALSACASLGTSSSADQFGSGLGLSPVQYQSWQEWAKKRNFDTSSGSSAWGNDPFSNGAFQDWREYMNKRGFHIPDSHQSQQQFQTWVEWNKRSQHMDAPFGESGGENPFKSSQDFGKFRTFQNWDDWYSKRSMGSTSPFGGQNSAVFGSLGRSPVASGNLQRWAEFMKRKGFAFGGPSRSFGYPQTNGLQSWNEWAKRFGPMAGSDSDTDSPHSTDKRQLSYRQPSFGSFHNYFTDGLQDWRSTFKGNKRGSDNEGKNHERSQSVMSQKAQDQ
ncbi:hypothetical protein EGW08_005179 [Elysia chlorotica]|uniref:Uncharacterized protein n=1 Tax=Elysia chlorotica TaxID=188477 RepID=A0A3S1HVQ5_ELYCH|nr:hypothetical protein EGW08_005179 [Elysia chlorotica]